MLENDVLHSIDAKIISTYVGESSHILLLSRLLSPRPLFTSAPSTTPEVEYFNFGSASWFQPEDGEVFGDGSCFFPQHPMLSRAGFSLVQITSQGSLVKGLWSAVLNRLPQDSQCAEFAALTSALEVSQGPQVVLNCQAVVNCWNKIPFSAMLSDNAFACAWKTAFLKGNLRTDRVKQVHKTKAHGALADLGPSPNELELSRFLGSAKADEHAKLAARSHYAPEGDIKCYFTAYNLVRKLAVHMSEFVAKEDFKIPTLSKKDPCHTARQEDRYQQPSIDRHDFVSVGPLWLCVKCLRRTHSPSTTMSTHPTCRRSSAISKVMYADLGHTLNVSFVQSGAFVSFCSTCWCYAESVPRLLCNACSGAPIGQGRCTTFCPVARDRILARLHPTSLRMLSKLIALRQFAA